MTTTVSTSSGPTTPDRHPQARRKRRRRALRILGYVLAWAVVAVPAWAVQFTSSSAQVLVASHETQVSPNFDGRVRLDMGPYLPDLRTSSGTWLGIDVEMGKTTADSTVELAQRYASIAAHPEAEQKRIRDEVFDLARNAAIPASVIGMVPVGLWLLLGRRRRTELLALAQAGRGRVRGRGGCGHGPGGQALGHRSPAARGSGGVVARAGRHHRRPGPR